MVAETDGTSIQKIHNYTLDGIAMTTQNNEDIFYIKNGHGDVIATTYEDGSFTGHYHSYDAFGNELSENQYSTDTFRYAGEYFDTETDLIYLRNRYYNSSNGRFITEDPIKDGLNWYVYCGGNPVMFADPVGLEKIVISGGSDGEENFKYNFIETAIKCIKDWKRNFPDESITWVIANWNYSKQDVSNFQSVAKSYGVNCMIIDDKQELFDYINTKNNGNRNDDLVSEMAFFAHGTAFDTSQFVNEEHKNDYAIALGLAKKSNNNLNIFGSDIVKIKSESFSEGNLTYFGSCRTGANFNDVNFAQSWVNMTKGIAVAAVQRTTYINIYPDNRSLWDKIRGKKASREIDRAKYGFAINGSKNYPDVVQGGSWVTVTANK